MEFQYSKAGFLEVLRYLKNNGYRITSFRDGADQVAQQRICLMRHDVDYSLQFAVELARWEAGEGVTSTYFIMVNSDLYNLFSRAGETAIREIVSLGHEIGLHWWQSRYPKTTHGFEEVFRHHLGLLQSLTGQAVLSVSQHDPTGDMFWPLPPLFRFNAYDRRFLKDILYISDSSRQCRTPLRTIETRNFPSLQLNLHPLYWVSSAPCMPSSLRAAFAEEVRETAIALEETIQRFQEALKNRQSQDQAFQQRFLDGTAAEVKSRSSQFGGRVS